MKGTLTRKPRAWSRAGIHSPYGIGNLTGVPAVGSSAAAGEKSTMTSWPPT